MLAAVEYSGQPTSIRPGVDRSVPRQPPRSATMVYSAARTSGGRAPFAGHLLPGEAHGPFGQPKAVSTGPSFEPRNVAVHVNPRQRIGTKNLPPRFCDGRIVKRPDIQNNGDGPHC
jgi:hypothetical protein